jgi:menaquinone-dependent protoporphyrinogen IX oxidase
MALFVECKNEKQIQADLKSCNVAISIRQIGYLAKKFIVYLALAHKQSRSKIKDLLSLRGGYILHLDGTCEGDSPHLMSALDEIAQIVLDNIKMPSEKADKIIPFLRRIKDCYGIPLALVHDMGAGILSAVKKVFPGVADYICHYHFLRDIGKDLFGIEYARIRSELSKYSIRASLGKIVKGLEEKIETQPDLANSLDGYLKDEGKSGNVLPRVLAYILSNWILDANSELNGYGFPFDRAHLIFYKRLKTARSIVENLSAKKKKDKYIIKLNRVLGRAINDKNLKTIVSRMEEKTQIFDELRDAMRIAASDGKKGLNDDGEDVDIKTIQKAVTIFRNSDKIKAAAEANVEYKKMVKQMDKYWEKLFADPIMVTTANGMYRSKSGTQSLNKVIKAMLADTPLVKNLSNPEYLKIILNGHDTLEERFAEIDERLVRQEMKKSEGHHSLSARMKKVLRKPNVPSMLAKMSKAAATL